MKARALGIALAAICIAMAQLAMLACAGCAPAAQVSESSPHAYVDKASIASSSELTEESQAVELSIPFDGDIEIVGDAAGDLDVRLDGDALNERTTQVSAVAEGDTLVVRLSPTPEAKGVDSPLYFACYQGKLEVSARDPGGALPHVASPEGAAAVLERGISATIPSGMRIQQLSSEPGRTVVEVTQFAQIRCCTWFDIGGERIFMHHHRFAQESERTCAATLAEAIDNSSAPYTAEADGAKVAISVDEDADPQAAQSSFDVSIVEGVGR